MDLSNAPKAACLDRARLDVLAGLGILDSAPEQDFDELTRLAAVALGVECAAISLLDDKRQWYKARHNIPFEETPLDVAFCIYTVASREILVVPDATLDPRFRDNPFVTPEDGIRFYAGVPLIVNSGHCLGTLCVFDTKARAGLDDIQLRLLADLARLASDLIEARRFNRMGEIASKVVDATSDAVLAVDPDGAIVYWNPAAEAMFGHAARDVLGHGIELMLPDGLPEPGSAAASRGEALACRADGSSFPVELSVAPWAQGTTTRGVAAILRDIGHRKALQRDHEHAKAFLDNVVSNLPAMLFVKDVQSRQYLVVNQAGEKVIGREAAEMIGQTDLDLFPEYGAGYEERDTEAAASCEPHVFESTFTRDDGETVHLRTIRKLIDGPDRPGQYILGISEDVTQIRQQEAEVLRLAHYDTLTGLLNRASFTDRIHRMVQERAPFAMLSIDLDRFKAVNDMFGHPVGDAVLVQVGERLNSVIGGGDWVARIGGDEFFAILPGENLRHRAEQVAEAIVRRLSAPFSTERGVAHLGASIGVVLMPEDGTTTEQLRENVDLALYRAKMNGRSGVCFFNSAMDAAAQDRRSVARDLRQAVANGEITLAYQPLICTRTGQVASAEALARWTHPDRGPIRPDIFIPMAEEYGLIDVLGEQLLRKACVDAQTWPEPLCVAVNLSPLQFLSNQLIATVREALKVSGLAPQRLQLEVTEGLLIRDVERTFAQLEQLRELGIQILIDDFGVGYSSLSYFQRFIFDKVKIDKSFINDIATSSAARAIVQAVVGLGQELGMAVVAEGVENEEQMGLLVGLGCTHLQGYLFSHPISAKALARFPDSKGVIPARTAA
ncbi:sensor domain-containing phosphodiesterase [Novosphingobium terrae]|uniref:sensor domain-containing phosphodiesterase n=1 Tax=Novosphingobium terrae TaxID=2726189 RepID=UPI0019809B8C|nr:EAL domain-containing protein [Novosphingobium terrae]